MCTQLLLIMSDLHIRTDEDFDKKLRLLKVQLKIFKTSKLIRHLVDKEYMEYYIG